MCLHDVGDHRNHEFPVIFNSPITPKILLNLILNRIRTTQTTLPFTPISIINAATRLTWALDWKSACNQWLLWAGNGL